MTEIRDLSFSYKKKEPLFSSLSLRLDEGSIYGLLGKNGAGKTTLLRIVCGLLFPGEGTCTVDGLESRKRLPSMKRPGQSGIIRISNGKAFHHEGSKKHFPTTVGCSCNFSNCDSRCCIARRNSAD